MEYSVKGMSSLSGVSTRTLRYYDEIGLLRPKRVSSNGYRIYGREQVDTLQQILFYRELDVPLEQIGMLLHAPDFDREEALRGHRDALVKKRVRLDALIRTMERTLEVQKGESDMSDKEKFDGFKHQMIEENERKYGAEIREKYGEDTVSASNQKFMNMSKEQYDQVTALGDQVIELFVKAFEEGDPAGGTAQEAADCHRQWLCFFWPSYSKEQHAGVAQMYVDDPRFTAYYDKHREGLARFVRDAVAVYTGIEQ